MFDRSFSIFSTLAVGFLAFVLPAQQGKSWKFPVQQLEQQVSQLEAPQQQPVKAVEEPAPVEATDYVPTALEGPKVPPSAYLDFASRDCCDQLEKRISKIEDRLTAIEKRCKCNQNASAVNTTVVPNQTVTYGQPIYSEPVYSQPIYYGQSTCGPGGCSTCGPGGCGPVRQFFQNQPIRSVIQR
jgi:hypothetical protein